MGARGRRPPRRWAGPKFNMYQSLHTTVIGPNGSRGDGAVGTARVLRNRCGEPKWTAKAEAESLVAVDDQAIYVVTEDRRLRNVGRSDARISSEDFKSSETVVTL